MANIIYAMGYSLGKTHTGMIVYLCDLYNDGEKEPLRTFLKHFKIKINADRVIAKKEYLNIDLVIFEYRKNNSNSDQKEVIIAAIEMKVDDHEHLVKIKKKDKKKHMEAGNKISEEVYTYQTNIYYERIKRRNDDNEVPLLFITLGMGECFAKPRNENVVWVKKLDMFNALDKIKLEDELIKNWKESIKRECDYREKVFNKAFETKEFILKNEDEKQKEYRSGIWNIYFLENIKNSIDFKFINNDNIEIQPEIYRYGMRPDTIFYIGQNVEDKTYFEINNNGMLNLKINLRESENRKEDFAFKQRIYKKLLNKYKPEPDNNSFSKDYKTKRMMTFDIGIEKSKEGYLFSNNGNSDICEKIKDIIKVYCDN